MSRIAKIIFKRSKVGKLFLTDIKMYFEASLQYGTDAEIYTLTNKTEQRAQGGKTKTKNILKIQLFLYDRIGINHYGKKKKKGNITQFC